MFLKKALSFWSFYGKGFLLNKKLVVFFVFMSLSVNGFAPSAAEVSRYSFIMAAATVAKDVIAQVFKTCDSSLSYIAGGFSSNMFDSLESTPINKSNDNTKSEDKECERRSTADEFYVTQPVVYQEVLEESSNYCPLSNIIPASSVFDTKPVPGFLFAGIIILFLIFISAIKRRKGIDGNIIKVNALRKIISV